MRDIKFRAWMFWYKKIVNVSNIDYGWLWENRSIAHIHIEWDWYEYESSYYTLMQYTWLKDKNWKEIYEWDMLVKHYDKIESAKDIIDEAIKEWLYMVVSPSLYNWREAYSETREVFIPDIYRYDDVEEREICGNIYENKDLLSNNTNG